MILLRHGQTMFNVVFSETRVDPGLIDPPLTEAGRAQAAAAAETLADHGVTRLVASPYTRALETAHIIADRLGVPVQVDHRVRERCAYACDVGTVRSRLEAAWGHFGFSPFEEQWWPAVEEPEADLIARCEAFRAAMAAADDWATVAVVTHWGVIRALTGQVLRNCETVRFDPTGAGR
ncbi:MAG: histidine phosphatase family protein [Rhodospirillales bacterium]